MRPSSCHANASCGSSSCTWGMWCAATLKRGSLALHVTPGLALLCCPQQAASWQCWTCTHTLLGVAHARFVLVLMTKWTIGYMIVDPRN
jgi:hypothetical protein